MGVLEASWGRLGGVLGVLGAIWASWRCLGGVLGASRRHLGDLGGILEASWGRLGGVLEATWAFWRRLGSVLGASWTKRPQLHDKNEHFMWEGRYFWPYPIACNMSPLGAAGAPLCGLQSGGDRPQCQTPLGLIPQSWPLRSIRGPRHSADPLTAN